MDSETALERNINKILGDLSEHFNIFYKSFEKELSSQTETCESIWVLVQRYKILKNGQDRLQRKDDDLSDRIEAEILTSVNRQIRKVHQSNKQMETSLKELKTLIETFQNEVANDISSCSTGFIEGDLRRQPIILYKELISDVFSALSNTNSRMKCFASLLDESDVESIEQYKKLLEPSDTFKNYFYTNLSYMPCLKNKTHL